MEVGANYTAKTPTIAIAFTNGTVKPIATDKVPNADKDKIHRLCMIMDCEDFTVFTDAMEQEQRRAEQAENEVEKLRQQVAELQVAQKS